MQLKKLIYRARIFLAKKTSLPCRTYRIKKTNLNRICGTQLSGDRLIFLLIWERFRQRFAYYFRSWRRSGTGRGGSSGFGPVQQTRLSESIGGIGTGQEKFLKLGPVHGKLLHAHPLQRYEIRSHRKDILLLPNQSFMKHFQFK